MAQISENDPLYSQKVSDRIIQLIENNKLYYSDDLKILKSLHQKYEVITISDYAKRVGKSYNGILDQVRRCKLATIAISNSIYILNKLN